MTLPSRRPARVLITGGSTGIGFALAQTYSAQGFDVLRVAKRAVSDGPGDYVPVDLAAADAADNIVGAVDAKGWDQIDILILNAGIGHVGKVEQTPEELADDMIAVNVTGPLELAHRLLPRIASRVVFIGSVAHKSTNPDFAIYGATKSALRGAVKSWQIERDGVAPFVQIIHPGPTVTEMHDRAGLGDIAFRRLFTPAPVVAAAIAKAIQGKKAEVSFGMGFMMRHAIGQLFR